MPDPPDTERLALVVEEEADGARIDRYLAERLAPISRSRIQKLIREGRILVDEAPCRASQAVREGQRITWPAGAGLEAPPLEPEAVDFLPVFEDDDLLVLHKPPGLVVHPAPGHWTGTLVHGLLLRWPGWRAPGGLLRPGIVHRLDRETSGLMVVARSARAFRSLQEQIAGHTAERAYIALAWGAMEPDRGVIEAPVGRDPRNRQRMAAVPGGRPAATQWQVLSRFDTLTLLRLVLRTGRTHQVRVHLSDRGHPVFADALYGGVEFARRLAPPERRRAQALMRELGRTALHAYRLAFRHPADGEWLEFEAPVPPDMERVLLRLTESGGAG
ncbi:MAG: RluA family pseudouridine synthase [Candidatus Eisenbacteria bacterium]|uniref:Pseudouridine synthase n=1 Tax=Eiseniibacteriota bacterium TaxID=2212470 RepID=A0A937X9F0_UNCEI|nr:RluA family pseudouridine synthase [Candidatus Eisenbacteria bacterium]